MHQIPDAARGDGTGGGWVGEKRTQSNALDACVSVVEMQVAVASVAEPACKGLELLQQGWIASMQ